MDRNLKIASILVAVSILLLFSTRFLRQLEPPRPDVEANARKVEVKLKELYSNYDSLVNNNAALTDLAQKGFASSYTDELNTKPYGFIIYRNNEPQVWNENSTFPPTFMAYAITDGSSFIKLENGYYEVLKTTRKIDGDDLICIALIPIRHNYDINNKYLSNDFNPIFGLPDNLQISLSGRNEQSVPVYGKTGERSFFLSVDESLLTADYINNLVIGMYFATFILLFIALYLVLLYLNERSDTWVSLAVMLMLGSLLRWLMLDANYPPELIEFTLFNPQMYASSIINRSLGDLLINILLLFWVITFFYRKVPMHRMEVAFDFLRYPIAFLIYLFIFLATLFLADIFRGLLVDSTIPFDFNDFLSLNTYTFIGLLCFSFALFGFLLVTHKLQIALRALNIPYGAKWAPLLLALGVFALFLYFFNYEYIYYLTAAWTLLYIVFVQRMLLEEGIFSSVTGLVSMLAMFSILSAMHIYNFNETKKVEKQKSFARKLSSERDPVTEYLFNDVQERILSDQFIRNYFLKPFISTQEIVERISTKYFSGYFNRYDLKVYVLNREGVPNADDKGFLELQSDELLSQNAEMVPRSDNLFYVPRPSGTYTYLGNIPIVYRNKVIGTVVMELNPKTYSNTNLYPELLLEENIKPSDDLDKYHYAIYSNKALIGSDGAYPYDYRFGLAGALNEEYTFVQENHLNHLIYQASPEKTVVVSSPRASLIQPISLFSYLFCIYLLLGFILVASYSFVKSIRDGLSLRAWLSLTLKDKIQFSMIFMIVISFFVIGFATVYYFTSEYDDTHRERLLSKERAVRSSIEYMIDDKTTSLGRQDFRDPRRDARPGEIDIAALSDIHGMDINIYDLGGELINTSQPDIFEKGLLSERIDPVAYKNLSVNDRSQFFQNEHIGKLNYLSIYVPIRNAEGRPLAYLNLPYFAREKELNQELSGFLVALINVYVLLLVLGGFLAYLLSDSVTRSLAAISEKLKYVKLGSENKPIAWQGNDEIGVLVAEYNKMIGELEESADLLARSERESAWREMAKQIAHEIKNPLTPMKLSIQHLQRAMHEGNPKAQEMATRVAATLIEQIDNLSHIATEFSSFAKMPTVKFERFDLGELLQSVVNLFNENERISITFTRKQDRVMIYADKNQLLRAFNNLVKNAIQAIPDDREAKIEVALYTEGNDINIMVKDNGVGIPKEQQEKVFVPNFTTKSSGMGLGLAITKQIVENSDGTIWFKSEENVGTSFFIKLPLNSNRRAVSAPENVSDEA